MNNEHDDRQDDNSTAGQLFAVAQTDPTFELFIMSESGKPVYSYSRRDDVVTLMPVCQALLNFAHKSQRDTLHSITTSSQVRINFAIRSPLIIIVVGQLNSVLDPIALITQIEAQIVSVLTSKTLTSVFQQRPTFDLKRLLQGSEKLIDAIAHMMVSLLEFQQRRALLPPNLVKPKAAPTNSSNDDSSQNDVNLSASQNRDDSVESLNSFRDVVQARQQWPWLQAFLSNAGSMARRSGQPELNRVLVPVVIMPSNYRDQYTNILLSAQSPSILFSLLFRVSRTQSLSDDSKSNSNNDGQQQTNNSEADDDAQVNDMRFELITVCNHHSQSHKLSIVDMQLLLALLYGSRSQMVSVESLWMPVCLPRFNEDAFLHAHISLLIDQTHCLLITTVDRDEFQKCQTFKTTCEERLAKMAPKFRDNYRLPSLLPPSPALQSSSSSIISQTNNKADSSSDALKSIKSEYLALRQVQFFWYQTQRRVLVWQQSPHWSMSRLIYYVARRMSASHLKTMWLKSLSDKTILGWHVSSFQLYVQFDATVTPSQALEAVQLLTGWIKKLEDCFTFKEYK